MPAEKLRWAVGSILAEGNEKADDALVEQFEAHGFKLVKFPSVLRAVSATFPYKTALSVYIYVYRMYTAAGNYMKVSSHNFCLI